MATIKRTIEEKAKAYDEALKVLHKYDGANIMFSQSLKEEMFPELKESEDERIRKAIRNLILSAEQARLSIFNITQSDAFAWLEKQGEQKPINVTYEKIKAASIIHSEIVRNQSCVDEDFIAGAQWLIHICNKDDEQKQVIVPKFMEGDIIKRKDTDEIFEVSNIEVFDKDEIYYHLTNGGCVCENSDNFELVEHKSVWSEEDEACYISIIEHLKYSITNGKPETYTSGRLTDWIDNRVKSLRPQDRWKPSDEQMKALHDINITGNISYAGQGQVLIELYNDLKKLREE